MRNFIDNSTFLQDDFLYINENIVGDYVKIEKVGQDIIFTSNYVSCPRIAFSVYNDEFIFDLGWNAVMNFVNFKFSGDIFKEVTEEPYCYFKESVRKDYRIKHIDFIENWSKVVVHPDGSFEKTDYPLIPYSVDLKDAYDLLHQLLLKYKKGIELLIEQNNFIPTLTGGVDTRCLTALWRDKQIDEIYIREIKNDGKNRVDLSAADMNCALKVAERLGITKHRGNLNGCKTITGLYTEATRGMYHMDVNDERFIYKFIQHQIRGNLIAPFADDLYLQIKHPKQRVFRCLLSLLLCPDLIDLKYIGTYPNYQKHNNGPYDFYEEYADVLNDAKTILNYWGEEKCANILKEDSYESI